MLNERVLGGGLSSDEGGSMLRGDPAACQYDASPESTLAAVRAHEGPLLVDLDETLYLRNSTEDFIDCAQPGLLALLLLRALDAVRPWRLTGGADTRDNWRVCAIQIFLPWTRWRWRAKAPFLAARHVNGELQAAIKARGEPPVVLTTGFNFIVAPLLAAMGLADSPLVAARASSFADRRQGKLRMATSELGAETLGRSLFVTDSIDDLEVLRNCARPLRTIWPQARYRRALSGVYLPGEYISQVKRPGKRYIFGAILQEDFAFWVLSSIGLAANPFTHLAGLLLLLLSFWAIYERGYVDNDLIASRCRVRAKAQPQLRQRAGRDTGRAALDLGAARRRGRSCDPAPRRDWLRRAFCTLGGGADFDVRLFSVLQPARQDDPRLGLSHAAIGAQRRIHRHRAHRAYGRCRLGCKCARPMGAVSDLPPDLCRMA